ncbi:MAG: hypothetical protein R6X19_09175 [Kiritimatiellia bacterium]
MTDEEQRDLTASAMALKKTLADLAGEDGKRDDIQRRSGYTLLSRVA